MRRKYERDPYYTQINLRRFKGIFPVFGLFFLVSCGLTESQYVDYSDPANPTFSRFGTYGDITGAYGNRVFKLSLRFTF